MLLTTHPIIHPYNILGLTAPDSSIAVVVQSAGWELKTLSLLTASLDPLHSKAAPLPPSSFLPFVEMGTPGESEPGSWYTGVH